MFLLVQWQVSGLGIIGFVGASHLSLVIQKGLKSGVCGGCSPALRMQKELQTTLRKLFPLGGAGLGCQLCLCQGTAAKRASGGRGRYVGGICWGISWGDILGTYLGGISWGDILGCSGPAGIFASPRGCCPVPLSIPVAAGSDGRKSL